MNTPPRYQIFHDLSIEVAKLVANLEKELRNKLDSAPQGPKTGSGGPSAQTSVQSGKKSNWPKFGGLKGFGRWLWTGKAESVINFYNKKRPTLQEYVDHEKEINKIFQEILKENLNLNLDLNEQYDLISDIFNKFKQDFFEILKKYAVLVRKEQEKEEEERSELIRGSGAPETASAEDIEKAYKEKEIKQQKEVEPPPVSDDIWSSFEKLTNEEKDDILNGLIQYKRNPSEIEKYRNKVKSEAEKLFFQIIDENKIDEFLKKYLQDKSISGVGGVEPK